MQKTLVILISVSPVLVSEFFLFDSTILHKFPTLILLENVFGILVVDFLINVVTFFGFTLEKPKYTKI